MTSKKWVVPCVVLAALALLAVVTAQARSPAQQPEPQAALGAQATLGPGFTYQGQLKKSGNPVTGNCDMAFRLYTDPTAGSQVGSAITTTVPITDGLFTVVLNDSGQFGGAAFTGNERWLGIRVKCPGDAVYADLGRQKLTAAPYALYALGAPWSGLTDVPAGLDDGDDDTTYTAGLGLIMTGTEMSVDFTVVAPLTHTHSFTSPDVLKYFQEEGVITTTGATDWEFFTLGSDAYLAVANRYDGSTFNVDSKIYRWDGAGFTEFQSIPTNGAYDWEFFTIGDDSYLVVANSYNGSTRNIDSKIYQWTGTSFTETQSIPTNSAWDWEFFTLGGDAYLAVANRRNDSTNNVDSKIYRWNGTIFTETQSIPTNGAADWEFFTIGGDAYLAVADQHNDSTYNIDSKIYRWNGTSFAEFQSIPTNGAFDWEFFTIGSNAYLAVANDYNGSTYNVASKIYRWNGAGFAEFQSISTIGAYDWEFFTVGSDAYLAVANAYNGSTCNVVSKVYRWNGTGFVEFQSIPTNCACDWEFFTLGSDFYLAAANSWNDSTHNIDSKIYKAMLESQAGTTYLWGQSGADVYYNAGNVGVGTTSPQSALQVEGYVQLDTLTAPPPAADCDEASERGRMKVDIVNDFLYICTNSGWVAK